MIIVSACLAGINCRYDGENCMVPEIRKMVDEGKAVVLCPEQLGGLPTPRPPGEIQGGDGKNVLEKGSGARIVTEEGGDVTNCFIEGAQRVLEVCRVLGIRKAVLKSRSPSCGLGQVYDGSFQGRLMDGNGVTAQLLLDNGITVVTEDDL